MSFAYKAKKSFGISSNFSSLLEKKQLPMKIIYILLQIDINK